MRYQLRYAPWKLFFPCAKVEKTIGVAKLLFESYGFGRLNARNNVAGADECEDRGEQSADIHEQHNGPIDVDGHRFKIVSGRVESKQSPLALCEGNAERKDVADEQTAEGDEDSEVEKMWRTLPLGGARVP